MADYTSVTPNMNRVISLKKEGLSSDITNQDWRHNVSFLLDLANMKGTTKKNLNFSKDEVDVNDNVYLLMTDKLPDIDNNISLKENEKIQQILGSKNMSRVSAVVSGLSALETIDYDATGKESGGLKQINPWIKNFKVWDPMKSSPSIKFSYTFKFNMGQYGLWNAKKEVFLPIVNLAMPTFLQQLNAATQIGPFPTEIGLLVNFINTIITDSKSKSSTYGEVATDLVNSMKTSALSIKEKLSNGESSVSETFDIVSLIGTIATDALDGVAAILEAVILDAYRGYTYEVKFGNFMTFRHMMITGSKFSFSNEVDQNGYPISGNITLTFESMMPPAFSSSGTTDRLPLIFGSNT